MTLRLILTRHAKSSWDDPRLADHDRVLNGRGMRACTLIGDWLANSGLQPDEVITSSATRTRETWERIAPSLAPVEAVRAEMRLYHAEPEMILQVLQGASGAVVMLVGHNPGIAEFAQRILREPPAHRDFRRYPTAATLVADFPIDNWSELRPSSGVPVNFIVPRELE